MMEGSPTKYVFPDEYAALHLRHAFWARFVPPRPAGPTPARPRCRRRLQVFFFFPLLAGTSNALIVMRFLCPDCCGIL